MKGREGEGRGKSGWGGGTIENKGRINQEGKKGKICRFVVR